MIVERATPADAFYLVRGGYVKVGVTSGSGDAGRHLPAQGRLRGRGGAAPRRAMAVHADRARARRAREARARRLAAQVLPEYPHIEARCGTTVPRGSSRRGRPRRQSAARAAAADGDGHRADPRRERAAHRPRDLHALRRMRARLRRRARRRAALHPRGHQVPQFQRADRLLPVHRSGLHDRLPDRRHHAAARHAAKSTIDKATCIGCGNCVRRCPWGNIIMVRGRKSAPDKETWLATKCDLCVGREPDRPACRCARTARPCV